MTMAKSVVPVASTVPAMPTVTVTSSEGLTGDGQRSSGQCQSRDCGGNDRLGLRHGRLLLGWAERGSLCDDPPLEALAAMRCDRGSRELAGSSNWYDPGSRVSSHAWRDHLLNSAWPDSKRLFLRLSHAHRRTLHPRLLRQERPGVAEAIRRPLRPRRRDPVRLFLPDASNTTTTSNRPNRCSASARRLPRCRRGRWCSSTRRAAWCGG